MTPELLAATLASLATLQASTPQSRPAESALLERIDRARQATPGGRRPAAVSMRGRYTLKLGGAPVDKPWEGPIEIDFSGDRAYERMDYGERGLMQRGWSGGVTWETHPVWGVQVYEGDEEAVIRRCLESIYWPGWRTLYREGEVTGAETLNGRPQHVVRMTPHVGRPDVWHVDQETALPTRIDFVISWGGETSTIQVEFGDWRPVGGLVMAHREKTTMGTTVGDVVYESIVADAPIDPARFVPPPEVAKAAATREKGGFQVIAVDRQPAATIRVKVKPGEVSRTLAVILPEVMAHLTESGARTAGAPFARRHGESGGLVDLEAGLPVAEPIAPKGRVKASELPGGRAAAAWHIGPYDALPEVHAKLGAWMKSQSLEASGGAWEVYWTDPGLQPDPTQFRTQILWPVK